MLQDMDKNLFEIFPDLPTPRRIGPLFRQRLQSIEHPPPPTTHVARLGLSAAHRQTATQELRRRQHVDDAALRRIRAIALAEYERLTPKGRLGGMLRTIIAVADAAMLLP